MAAYNFQKQFAPKIKAGTKRSTIRARRKTGYVPVAGEVLKLYSGMRTRECKLLAEVTVKKVRPIIVNTTYNGIDGIILDGQLFGPRQIHKLVIEDGFESAEEFAGFFNKMHGDSAQLYLIEW